MTIILTIVIAAMMMATVQAQPTPKTPVTLEELVRAACHGRILMKDEDGDVIHPKLIGCPEDTAVRHDDR